MRKLYLTILIFFIMRDKKSFELSNDLITQDNYDVEVKGIYLGKLSQELLQNCFQKYLAKTDFIDSLILVEKDDLNRLEIFSSIGAVYLKVSTISAIQQENNDDRYAINPDLEGGKKRKGLFARLKK